MMLMKAMEARKKAEVSTSLCRFAVVTVSVCGDQDKSSVFGVLGCVTQLEQQVSGMVRVLCLPGVVSQHGAPEVPGPSISVKHSGTEGVKRLCFSLCSCV